MLSVSSSPHTSHIRLRVPSTVQVGSVTVSHAPQVCPVASISRLSVVASHLVQCLDSLPFVTQSGSASTVYSSSKSCPSAGMMSVSSSPHTSHIRFCIPSAVQVGSVTASHVLQVWAASQIAYKVMLPVTVSRNRFHITSPYASLANPTKLPHCLVGNVTPPTTAPSLTLTADISLPPCVSKVTV